MEKTSGYVDCVSLKAVYGWARPPASVQGHETVVIRVNNRVYEAPAKLPRPDLAAAGLGDCAFTLELPFDSVRDDFVEIEVLSKTTGRTLEGGFRTFVKGSPANPMLKEWAEASSFPEVFTWIKDSSLAELNARLHEEAGPQGEQALQKRARDYIEAFTSSIYGAGIVKKLSQKVPVEILDFGPGVGWPMQYLLETFEVTRVTGLDISKNALARLRERLSAALPDSLQSHYTLQHYEGRQFPWDAARFDLAMALACLHHIPEEWLYLYFQEFHRVLKTDGILMGQITDSVSNYRHKPEIEREFTRRREKNFEVHPHFYHSRETVIALLNHAGFKRVAILENTGNLHYISLIARK